MDAHAGKAAVMSVHVYGASPPAQNVAVDVDLTTTDTNLPPGEVGVP